MPLILSDKLGLAFDMHGCPNRCRHCDYGLTGPTNLSEQDLRWGVQQFREYIQSRRHPHLRQLSFSTWMREPDFSDDYKTLYQLEKELSDSDPGRYELLSIWRLARDAEYARWAAEIGTRKCQITFFGLQGNTDWFYRRNGAFHDALAATERLLEVGITPRWQWFLTTKIIPELPALLELVDHMQLRERSRDKTEHEFELYLWLPTPIDAPCDIEPFRPTLDDVRAIPQEILDISRAHFKTDCLWYPERELYRQIMDSPERYPYAIHNFEMVWLFIKGNWDVFSNLGSLEAWWKLGNLKADPVAEIIERLETNAPLGLHTCYTLSPKKLAEQFGDPDSSRLFCDKDDLLHLYLAKYLPSQTDILAT